MSDEAQQLRRHEEVLVRVVDVLEQAGIPYALMGGLATAGVGRERTTKDVDIFLTSDHADAALEGLGRAGFRTERTDSRWLYKAFWDESLVDLIFESSGGIVFDEEMRSHRRAVTVLGREVQALAAEDILVIKALAAKESRPRHWYDAVAIAAGSTELNWAYLLHRARAHSARVLSLLLYAASEGAQVPAEPLRELFEEAMRLVPSGSETEREHHLAARVREALATNPEIAEPDVSVVVANHQILVRGEVATPARKEAIEGLLAALGSGNQVRSELEVAAD